MLEMVYALKNYIERELVPAVTEHTADLITQIDGLVDAMRADLEADREIQAGLYQEFTDSINAVVELINNKTGPIPIHRVTATGAHSVTINPLWPNNQPVYYSVQQDATGNRAVTLASNITGPLDVNLAANGTTDFWLIPRADKTSWYVFQPTAGTRGTINDKATAKLVAGDTETRTAVDARIAPVALSIRADATVLGKTVADLSTASTAGDKANSDSLAAHAAKVTKIYPLDAIDAVFIGDSYFMGYQSAGVDWLVDDMPTRITKILNDRGGNQYRKHNYSVAATGFDRGGVNNSYSAQFDRAAANTAITNCRLVFVGGGQNDAGTDVYEKAKTLFTRIRAKWPMAKIVFAPMWHPGQFKNVQRRTFMAGFRAAQETGVIHDVNSLWAQSITGRTDWYIESNVWHPKAPVTQSLAHVLVSLSEGGKLPAQSIDMQMHSSNGITEGVATLNGFDVNIAFQQNVGASFTASYLLGKIGYEVLTPAGINQYMNGFAGSGAELRLFTVEAGTGNIFVTGSGTAAAGICGFTGSYPVGM